MDPSQIKGKRVSILGAARSGLAAAALLKRHGAIPFVSDSAAAENFVAAREELDTLGAKYEFGTNSPRVLEADLIVLSPGVPSDVPTVHLAHERRIPVVSEIELGSWFCRGTIVGITGTNGKTTTTTLTGKLFEDGGFATVTAGNIGLAFCQVADEVSSDSIVVLEVSSFQLDHADSFRPKVSVVLNITPDHLDRYGHSFERYRSAKARIFQRQGEGDSLVFNADDPETVREVRDHSSGSVSRLPFSLSRPVERGAWIEQGVLRTRVNGPAMEILPVRELGMIPGAHNQYNAMASVLAALALGVDPSSISKTLKTFAGVEHRLEFVREVRGVKYVND